MKKLISAFLLVTILCSLTGCSSEKYENLVSKYDKLQQKYDMQKDKYDDVQAKYDDLKAKYDDIEAEYAELTVKHDALDTLYNAFTESQMAKTDIVFEGFGQAISDEAVTSVMGDVVVVKLPYVSDDDSIEIVGQVAGTLGSLMSTADYKSCLLLFVDHDGDCIVGFNFSRTTGVSYFMIQD